MPTTSSPWASPSSPAGRRLLQSEPATADIPVLDEAALALGAALVAASPSPSPAPRPAVSPRGARPSCRSRRRPVARRGFAAAALTVGVLAAGATGGVARPTPVVSSSVAAEAGPVALARAAGATMGSAEVAPPTAGGQVVVALIAPTEALRAVPVGVADPSLAARMGTLVALVAQADPAG